MFPLLDTLCDPNLPRKDLVALLSSINHHHGAKLDEKQVAGVKCTIRKFIGQPETRVHGLLLYECMLQQDTPFIFSDWQKILLANFQSPNKVCQNVTYRICQLILKGSKYPCSTHDSVKFEPIVLELLKLNENQCLAAIQCLSLCIKHHPAAVFKKLSDVECLIMKHMGTHSTKISEALADCFANLPRCLPAKENGKDVSSKHFTNACKKALYTVQGILNKLLHTDDVHLMDESCEDVPETYPLPELPDEQASATLTLARTFTNFSICVAKFLCSENSGIAFDVPVVWILELMSRVFDLSQHSKDCTTNLRYFSIVLAYPAIHKGAFIILEALILNYCLVEQVENIILIVRKAIEASLLATLVGEKNCLMRYICWRILSVWFEKNGTRVSIEAVNRKFIFDELLKDIIPERVNPMEEENGVTQKRSLSPKGKKSETVSPELDETSAFYKYRVQCCNEALKVLHHLISTTSPFLDEKIKEEISNVSLMVCKRVQRGNNPRKFPFPYMDDSCRKNLYKLVLSFVVSSDFNSRVMSLSIAVLTIAQRDRAEKIKNFCRKANLQIRNVLYTKRKFPEVTYNVTPQESRVDESPSFGWEPVPWHATQENHSANVQNDIPQNHAEPSHDSFNSVEENDRQSNLVSNKDLPSEKDYNTSKFDTSQNSSQSESESESIMDHNIEEIETNQETNVQTYITASHSNEMAKREETTAINVSSEEDSSSLGDEELEDARDEEEDVEEEEEKVNEITASVDQNGLASTSEDEEVIDSIKGENGDVSSEEATGEDEEDAPKENSANSKHVIENLDEDERPMKKQRLNEETLEISENSNEVKTEEVKNERLEDEQPSDNADESRRSASPTLEEMCGDLVLCESSELAES